MATKDMAAHRAPNDGNARLSLLAVVASSVASAAALWWLTGPPTMLAAMPEWGRIRDVLGGARLADGDAITVAAGIAWLALIYLGLSLLVRLGLGFAAALTSQAPWTQVGLRLSAPLTLPLVRRVVDGALAATIVVSASLQAHPATAAGSGAAAVAVQASRSPAHVSPEDPVRPPAATSHPEAAVPSVPASYTVVPGDALWRISERFLGDGFRWTDIWALNQQRQMADGRLFVNPNLIYPGWVLDLPQDATPPAPPVLEEEEPTSTPEPTPTPSPPAPEPTAEAPAPTATAGQAEPGSDDTTSGDNASRELQPPVPGKAALATFAALSLGGAAMLLVFRRYRREHAPGPGGGRGQRPAGAGDVGRVMAVTGALQLALAELDFQATAVVLVRESDRFLEFSLDCPPGDANAIVAARHEIGRQLGCAVDGEDASPTCVRLKLSRLSRLAAALFGEAAPGQPLIVPVGASESGIYYLNLAAVGSVLVAGRRLETRDLLTTWLTTLASLHPPEDLTVIADGAASEHLGDALSRLKGEPGEGAGDISVAAIARRLEETIVQDDGSLDGQQLLAFTGPAPDIREATNELETVLRQGPAHGIFVVSATEGLPDAESQQAFGASVVLGEEQGGDSTAAMMLTVPRQQPLRLEPVAVRQQTAHRPPRDTARAEPVSWSSASLNGTQAIASEPVSGSVGGEGDLGESSGGEEAGGDLDEPGDILPGQGNVLGDQDPSHTPAPVPSLSRQSALPLDAPDDDGEPPVQTGPLFRVRCFGAFRVETAMGEVNGWTIQKARELLACLLAHGGTPVLRETVAEALWPDGEADQVDHQLSNAAYYLRRTLSRAAGELDGQALVTASQRYHLRSGLFRVDVDAFDAHIGRAERLKGYEALIEYERALALYTGDFLSDEIYEWAEVYRRDYQKRFVTAAHRAARLAFDCRDPKMAIRFYDGILGRDPIDEEAVRGLMQCHAALGDTNAVKRAYKALVGSLRRELEDDGAEPLPETTKALGELVGQRAPAR